MSIPKKSLIKALNTTKKADVATANGTTPKKETVASLSQNKFKHFKTVSLRIAR